MKWGRSLFHMGKKETNVVSPLSLTHSTKPGTEEEPLLSPRLTPAAACTVPADRGREEQASKERGRT